jgi:arylsulfatase A-like enzyme
MTDQLSRRDFLGVAAGTAAVALAAPRPARAETRPNVLFILADDLGYGDLSSYGRPDYDTPVLDRLAEQGMKFTSAYAAAPVCTPTRCAFITGRYPQRFEVGLEEPLTAESPPVGLPASQPTIGTRLQAAGYETALIGKWHLGWRPEYRPNRHGFDEFYGSLSGALDYFTHIAPDAGEPLLPDLWHNDTRVTTDGYLTDVFSDRAVEYVSRARSKPFYLSLHYNAPHAPWEGPADRAIDHTDHGPGAMYNGGSLATYAQMMRSMDEGIGRVLAALRRARLERDTLVIFTSDNGGERYSFNWPFSFEKLYLYEGGIRVPAIVRWPGVVPAGAVTDQAATTMDWTATILAAADAQLDPAQPLDGESLLPVLRGERTEHERTLFWRTRTRAAARIGKWKYVQEGTTEHLYDLSVDLGEKTDLKERQAAAFSDTKRRYAEWAAGMLPRPT